MSLTMSIEGASAATWESPKCKHSEVTWPS